MAIQKLDIHGFRSFREVSWQPGSLNLLVGLNGSGKSNLLRFLELIASTARGKLARSIAEAGGMVPLLWDQRATGISWTLRIDPVDPGRNLVDDALTLEFELEHLRQTSAYQIALDSLGNWVRYERGEQPSPLWIYRRDVRGAMVYDQRAQKLVSLDDVDPNESLLAQISDPRANPIPTHTRRFLEAWRIYHDVHVERGAPMRLPATTQYAKLVEPDGSNLVSVLHTLYTTDREFKHQIDEGMRAGFGDQFEELVFQPAAAQQIQLAIQWRSSKQPHAGQDLSDGTLRFLFLLTVLASREPATLLAIDEPEAGLHPSMLPIIAEYAAEAARRTQLIITSHSPVFLDAFSNVGPQVTLLHWEEGQTQFIPLNSDVLTRWLEQYRLGQLFTSGDLEALSASPVEAIPDLGERAKGLPPEDAALADLPD
ncbi:MAG TPA: AAA family ATPase [Gemmataceae bacterium]|nr:AAA family ATPase [Gemmataceae bacterium]